MKFQEEIYNNYSVSAYSKEAIKITKELKTTFTKFTDELYLKLGEQKMKAGAK